eukprot:TRINITY_DN3271_c1_g1_i1.p1 TRINITY_DN3271_c1_g1~~TRINITY_DN3271_c1_g1_i1.p1  ORF type:complete len:558 (-),score=190.25 TRINITY_DN3271_c1_g1_i1:41-1675(-)
MEDEYQDEDSKGLLDDERDIDPEHTGGGLSDRERKSLRSVYLNMYIDTQDSKGLLDDERDIDPEHTGGGLSDRERKSLRSVYLNMYIDTMMFAIFLPVLPLYLQDLGAGPSFLGFTISSFNFASLVTGPIVGAWASKRRIAEPMIICLLGGTIGFLVYISVENQWAIWASRVIVGASSNIVSLGNAFVAMVSTPEERTRAMNKITIFAVLGFLSGSALSIGCSFINFTVGSFVINEYTSVGWVCLILCGINAGQLLLWFREPPKHLKHQTTVTVDPSSSELVAVDDTNWVGAIVWMVLIFLSTNTWTSFEVVNTLFVTSEYNWQIHTIGLIWIGSGLLTFAIVLSFGILVRLGDRFLFYFFWCTLIFSQLLLIHYRFESGDTLPVWCYLLSVGLLSVSFIMQRIVISSNFSIAIGRGFKGQMMGWFGAVSKMGTIVISPIAGYLYHRCPSGDCVWIMTWLLLTGGLALAVVMHRWIFLTKPKEEPVVLKDFSINDQDDEQNRSPFESRIDAFSFDSDRFVTASFSDEIRFQQQQQQQQQQKQQS